MNRQSSYLHSSRRHPHAHGFKGGNHHAWSTNRIMDSAVNAMNQLERDIMQQYFRPQPLMYQQWVSTFLDSSPNHPPRLHRGPRHYQPGTHHPHHASRPHYHPNMYRLNSEGYPTRSRYGEGYRPSPDPRRRPQWSAFPHPPDLHQLSPPPFPMDYRGPHFSSCQRPPSGPGYHYRPSYEPFDHPEYHSDEGDDMRSGQFSLPARSIGPSITSLEDAPLSPVPVVDDRRIAQHIGRPSPPDDDAHSTERQLEAGGLPVNPSSSTWSNAAVRAAESIASSMGALSDSGTELTGTKTGSTTSDGYPDSYEEANSYEGYQDEVDEGYVSDSVASDEMGYSPWDEFDERRSHGLFSRGGAHGYDGLSDGYYSYGADEGVYPDD